MNLSACLASSCQKISKIAISQLGKAYEWLQVAVPVVMEKAALVASKVAIASKPYLAILGQWALVNKDFLITGGCGILVGATIASFIFYKMKPETV